MSLLKCPRCGAMVEASVSPRPRCAACNFPEPDTRPVRSWPATPLGVAPLASAPSDRHARPIGVAILAVVGLVAGVRDAGAGSLAAAAGSSLLTGARSEQILGAIFLSVGPVIAALGTLQIIAAVGLWKGRSWAWTLQITLLGLHALSASFRLLHGSAAALPGLVVTLSLGWYFLRPGVKAYFGCADAPG